MKWSASKTDRLRMACLRRDVSISVLTHHTCPSQEQPPGARKLSTVHNQPGNPWIMWNLHLFSALFPTCPCVAWLRMCRTPCINQLMLHFSKRAVGQGPRASVRRTGTSLLEPDKDGSQAPSVCFSFGKPSEAPSASNPFMRARCQHAWQSGAAFTP